MQIFIFNDKCFDFLLILLLLTFRIFSIDIPTIPFDNSMSDSTQNNVVYDNNKNQILNNSAIKQRSLSDIYVAFK